MRHDLYFLKQEDAHNALVFINDEVTPEVGLDNDKVTFFTRNTLTSLAQVKILKRVNTYMPVFNINDSQKAGNNDYKG